MLVDTRHHVMIAVTVIRPGAVGFCPEVGLPSVVATPEPTPAFLLPPATGNGAIATAAVGIHLKEAPVWHLGFG